VKDKNLLSDSNFKIAKLPEQRKQAYMSMFNPGACLQHLVYQLVENHVFNIRLNPDQESSQSIPDMIKQECS